MTDFAWLVEAPGPTYLAVRQLPAMHGEFYWTREADKALRFWSKPQADDTATAARRLQPGLWAFALTLGEAFPVEHGFLTAPEGGGGGEAEALIDAARGFVSGARWEGVDPPLTVALIRNLGEALAALSHPAPPSPGAGEEVIDAIAAERRRQVEVEGWSCAHDDAHDSGELAHAAACYAAGSTLPDALPRYRGVAVRKALWPWALEWWKPGPTRRRSLIKAGALIVAEIERLDRAISPTPAETAEVTREGRSDTTTEGEPVLAVSSPTFSDREVEKAARAEDEARDEMRCWNAYDAPETHEYYLPWHADRIASFRLALAALSPPPAVSGGMVALEEAMDAFEVIMQALVRERGAAAVNAFAVAKRWLRHVRQTLASTADVAEEA